MKKSKKESVLHDWVMKLPFTQQALLVMATRGADNMPKNNHGKSLIHYFRGAILKPAYSEFNGELDGYMRTDYGSGESFKLTVVQFFKDMDSYPMHFLLHLIHAAEVVAYNCPDKLIKECWSTFYKISCDNFHMNPETVEQLNKRLNV